MGDLFELIEHRGMCRVLLYYLDHPNQVMRVDYRKKPLNLSGSASTSLHKVLLKEDLIKPIPNTEHVIFGLTERGISFAKLIRELDRKAIDFKKT